MPDEHIERAARALMASLGAAQERLDDWLPHAAACVEAWNHGGATLSEADCRMIAKEVGSIAERRLVVHGPQPDHS
jgi:hypothetical protein